MLLEETTTGDEILITQRYVVSLVGSFGVVEYLKFNVQTFSSH